VALEPWCDEIHLAPGQKVELAFIGPRGGAIEVEAAPGGLTICGWAGSTFEVRPL
jgi:hypothetical protein